MNTVVKPLSVLIFSLTLLFLSACSTTAETNNKIIIGPTINVNLLEANIDVLGRVDTGAATTSINAKILNISEGTIEYLITNENGKATRLRSRIVKQSIVRNAESREQRYVVELTINYLGVNAKTLVNLNNREDSSYKILLGRNWLAGRYIVDVEK